MVNWIIVGIILVLVFILLKTKEVKHRIFTVVGILAVLFLIVTVSPILTGADFTSFNGIVSVSKTYFSWLGHVFSNLGDITGNALKLDWGGNVTK